MRKARGLRLVSLILAFSVLALRASAGNSLLKAIDRVQSGLRLYSCETFLSKIVTDIGFNSFDPDRPNQMKRGFSWTRVRDIAERVENFDRNGPLPGAASIDPASLRNALISTALWRAGVQFQMIRNENYPPLVVVSSSGRTPLNRLAKKIETTYPGLLVGFRSDARNEHYSFTPFRRSLHQFPASVGLISLRLRDAFGSDPDPILVDHEIGHGLMELPENADHFLAGGFVFEGAKVPYLDSASFNELFQTARSLRKDNASGAIRYLDYVYNLNELFSGFRDVNLPRVIGDLNSGQARFEFYRGGSGALLGLARLETLDHRSFHVYLTSARLNAPIQELTAEFIARLRRLNDWVVLSERDFHETLKVPENQRETALEGFAKRTIESADGYEKLIPKIDLSVAP